MERMMISALLVTFVTAGHGSSATDDCCKLCTFDCDIAIKAIEACIQDRDHYAAKIDGIVHTPMVNDILRSNIDPEEVSLLVQGNIISELVNVNKFTITREELDTVTQNAKQLGTLSNLISHCIEKERKLLSKSKLRGKLRSKYGTMSNGEVLEYLGMVQKSSNLEEIKKYDAIVRVCRTYDEILNDEKTSQDSSRTYDEPLNDEITCQDSSQFTLFYDDDPGIHAHLAEDEGAPNSSRFTLFYDDDSGIHAHFAEDEGEPSLERQSKFNAEFDKCLKLADKFVFCKDKSGYTAKKPQDKYKLFYPKVISRSYLYVDEDGNFYRWLRDGYVYFEKFYPENYSKYFRDSKGSPFSWVSQNQHPISYSGDNRGRY